MEKESPSIYRDLFILANFKGNQGAAFTSLSHLHSAFLKYFTVDSTFLDFRKDAFFNVLRRHSSLLYQDVGAISNIASYQFRRENLLVISGLLEHYGMGFSLKTLKRGFSNYDAIIHQDIPFKVDCYSPKKDPIFLDSKLSENPDNNILVGNFENDYTELTAERVIGTSTRSLQILATVTGQDVDVNTLRKTSDNIFSLEEDVSSFTTNLTFLNKQLYKK